MQEPSQQPEKNKSSVPKKQANAYLKYSAMAFQMGAIIAVFSFIGQKIDTYYEATTSYWTAGFALLGVCFALYFLLKDVLNEATQAFLQSLDQYTIADLIRNKPQLLKIIG